MNAKKAILALVVVFLGFWMFTDPKGLADAAQGAADVEPGLAGKHDVENDRLEPIRFRRGDSRGAIADDIDIVALRREPALQQRGDVGVVLDYENRHRQATARASCAIKGKRMRTTVPFWPDRFSTKIRP